MSRYIVNSKQRGYKVYVSGPPLPKPLSSFGLAPSAKPLQVNQTCSIQVEWLRLASRIDCIISLVLSAFLALPPQRTWRGMHICSAGTSNLWYTLVLPIRISISTAPFEKPRNREKKENQPPHEIGPKTHFHHKVAHLYCCTFSS